MALPPLRTHRLGYTGERVRRLRFSHALHSVPIQRRNHGKKGRGVRDGWLTLLCGFEEQGLEQRSSRVAGLNCPLLLLPYSRRRIYEHLGRERELLPAKDCTDGWRRTLEMGSLKWHLCNLPSQARERWPVGGGEGREPSLCFPLVASF